MTLKNENVIFLDVDGVLNLRSDWNVIAPDIGFARLNFVLLENFKICLARTKANVVLTSTWRKDAFLLDFLKKEIPIYDVTENFGNRGVEVASYIQKNEVKNYVIVDDDSGYHDENLRRFFQTDPVHGFNETISYRVTYCLLKGEEC